MKTKAVEIKDMEKLSPIFKGKKGNRLAKFFMHIFAIDKVNWVYERSCDYTGSDFAGSLLNDLGANYVIGNVERLKNLPEGAFITISNHPYGGLDGIMLVDLMAGIRPDYKLMVNQFLTMVETMDDNFIPVKPRVGKRNTDPTAQGINGIRETLAQLQGGHPVGFFPAGAVSMFRFRNLRIRDREWQKSIVRLIQMAKVPVLPIRFFDYNSRFFYFLGIINWRIRSLRMPYELFNKKGHRHRIGIGEMISVEEQAEFKDYKLFGTFLRKSVYDMPKPKSFTPRTILVLPNKLRNPQK
ncbi:MAG: lysophospholipid acyltransferase family protein [Bacteroidales bacterium]|nr:lysophospholipid acyltransferase family protein [Bacteroidales bacterium]